METRTGPLPPWNGFHHVAPVTLDLDAALAFYREVPGMSVGEIREGGGVFSLVVKHSHDRHS